MLVSQENISAYIPQRPPFVFIDELLHADESGFTSRFKIKPDCLLLHGNELSSHAVIENIAQTCAAGFGFLHQQAGKKAGELGFIGAVSKLEVVGHVFVNQGLQTEIKILNQFENIHLVEGISYSNNKEILKCQLKIVLG